MKLIKNISKHNVNKLTSKVRNSKKHNRKLVPKNNQNKSSLN
jgi:hypothetical protein